MIKLIVFATVVCAVLIAVVLAPHLPEPREHTDCLRVGNVAVAGKC